VTRLDDLRQITLFAGLSDQSLADLALVSVEQLFDAGQVIILQGDPASSAYFIVHGQVRVYRLSLSGREQVLARLGPGNGFNTVHPFHESALNHATVEAFTSATVLSIPSDSLRELTVTHADLAQAMLGDFAMRLDHLTDLVEDLSLRTVRGRMARFLLEQASVEADPAGEDVHVARRWTQDEIAASLGTVRDMVGRTLRSFSESDLIEINRDRIELLDRQGLEVEAAA